MPDFFTKSAFTENQSYRHPTAFVKMGHIYTNIYVYILYICVYIYIYIYIYVCIYVCVSLLLKYLEIITLSFVPIYNTLYSISIIKKLPFNKNKNSVNTTDLNKTGFVSYIHNTLHYVYSINYVIIKIV